MTFQTILLILGFSVTVIIAYQWLSSIDKQWDSVSLFYWCKKYDWLSDSRHILAASVCFNTVTLGAFIAGLFLVKKWIKNELHGQRRWRCSKDGNFLVYFVAVLLLTFGQIAVTIWIYLAD